MGRCCRRCVRMMKPLTPKGLLTARQRLPYLYRSTRYAHCDKGKKKWLSWEWNIEQKYWHVSSYRTANISTFTNTALSLTRHLIRSPSTTASLLTPKISYRLSTISLLCQVARSPLLLHMLCGPRMVASMELSLLVQERRVLSSSTRTWATANGQRSSHPRDTATHVHSESWRVAMDAICSWTEQVSCLELVTRLPPQWWTWMMCFECRHSRTFG